MAALGIIGFLVIIISVIALVINAIRRKKLRIWGIIAVVGLALFIIGMSLSDSDEQSPSPPQIQEPAPISEQEVISTPDATQIPAITEITATDLYSAYKANEVAADTNYKGKTLKITGTVMEIGKDIFDTPYVMLQGGTTYLESMMGVRCEFDREYESELAQLAKGDTVTIQGEVSSYMVDVFFKDSILIR